MTVGLAHERLFQKAGIDLKDHLGPEGDAHPFAVVRIEESDPTWGSVSKLVSRLEILDIIETEFDADELAGASVLRFQSLLFTGYPEPSLDNQYLSASYDLSDYCDLCGVGKSQLRPLRVLKAPKLGERRQTWQLYWILDEVLLARGAWEAVFEPFGVPCWPVLNKAGRELDGVVQLRIDSFKELSLPSDLSSQVCKKCGRRKFAPMQRGYWPMPKDDAVPAIFKSDQWFGYEHAADRDLFVSRDLYTGMKALNCKFWACR